jgi:hypothetical protein
MKKTQLSVITLLVLSFNSYAQQPLEWHSVADKKIQAISGIAVIDDEHYLVVHDRKKPEHPRLGIVEWKKNQPPTLKQIDWCDMANLPSDLEAITAVPNHQQDYLVLESHGKVTRIQLTEADQCKVTARFDLPETNAQTNLEALHLHCFTQQCLLVWADRGDEKRPAVLSWAKFDIDKNKLETPTDKPFAFNAPFPVVQHKSISDVVIDQHGVVWVGATSDPGDDGDYASGLYQLGKFSETKNQIVWQAFDNITPLAKYEYENIKIEGLTFIPHGLIMATDDENLGAKVAIMPLQ